MQKTINIWLVSILGVLSGCAELNSHFDCAMRPGVHCESLDQVNARVDRGEIGHEAKIISTPPVNVTSAIQPITLLVNSNSTLRTPDQVMRIWIAPFEDDTHNYHAASVIYTVVQSSRWAVPSTHTGEA